MKTALAIIGFIVFSFVVYLGFYNAYYSPKIDIQEEGGEFLVYKSLNGHYHLTDSLMKDVFNEVYERNGIVVTKGFGMYYNDPKEVGENPMQFDAGCIVEDKDSAQLVKIDDAYQISISPKGTFIISDFPLKGKMSIMFGMFKVYPKLNKYCKNNGYDQEQPVMEIYDRENRRIHYRRKLVKL